MTAQLQAYLYCLASNYRGVNKWCCCPQPPSHVFPANLEIHKFQAKRAEHKFLEDVF